MQMIVKCLWDYSTYKLNLKNEVERNLNRKDIAEQIGVNGGKRAKKNTKTEQTRRQRAIEKQQQHKQKHRQKNNESYSFWIELNRIEFTVVHSNQRSQ